MKIHCALYLLFSFFFTVISYAQPQIQWQKSYGGTNSDIAYSIQQTTDGGYIIAGSSGSNDGDVSGNHDTISANDFWVIKIDIYGTIQWQKSFGGPTWDDAYSIQQTSDGGYIVAGRSNANGGDVTGNHGGDDYWIVKIDNAGNIQWQKSLGCSGGDYAYSIIQTNEGGYIVAGMAGTNDGDVTGNHGGYDYWIVKLNNTGDIEWQKSYGGTEDDRAYSIQQTSDGGFIIGGSSTSNDGDVTGHQGPVPVLVESMADCP